MGAVSIDSSEIEALLHKYSERATKLAPQMESIAADIVAFVEDQFASGGDGKWQKLSDRYLKWKLAQGKSATPLTFNGMWSGSHRAEFDNESASTSTNASYAIFHVSKEARHKIPYRSPYDLTDEVVEDASKRVAHFLCTGKVT